MNGWQKTIKLRRDVRELLIGDGRFRSFSGIMLGYKFYYIINIFMNTLNVMRDMYLRQSVIRGFCYSILLYYSLIVSHIVSDLIKERRCKIT
jgi:hypothetical protein